MKETIVKQQLDLSKFDKGKRDKEHMRTKAQEKQEREEREQIEREGRGAQEREEMKKQEKAERELREKERDERECQELEMIEKETRQRAEREAKERAAREVREQDEREAECIERKADERAEEAVRIKFEKETKEAAERESKEKVEQEAKKSRYDRWMKPSGSSQEERTAEEVELRTPQMKDVTDTPSNLSEVATPSEIIDQGKLDIPDLFAKVSIISPEDEPFTDAEQEPCPPESPRPALASEVIPEALSNSNLNSLTPHVSALTPTPGKLVPDKPLSLWKRKKRKTAVQPASALNLFGAEGATNSLGGWGDAGGGGSTETIAMPTITEDRWSIFTDTARDQKRENQRENLVEGFLGSNQGRRRNDSAQPQITMRPATKPGPGPAPAQKSGWGSWGSTLLGGIASAVEPPSVRPKIEDTPRGFTPNQPLETEERTKIVETPIPVEEDEFDWGNSAARKKKKKGQVSIVTQTPSVPNTPDLYNADDGTTGGGGKKKKKKKYGGR